jgi:fructose-specific component phosphotransferase system IIB-like protein
VTAYTLTQSLNAFAKRSPAEIIKADDTANLKIAAYEDIWGNSTVLV